MHKSVINKVLCMEIWCLFIYLFLSQGDIECVQYLLEHDNVGINLAGNSGITPLHIAAMCGHAEVRIELFLYMKIIILL